MYIHSNWVNLEKDNKSCACGIWKKNQKNGGYLEYSEFRTGTIIKS